MYGDFGQRLQRGANVLYSSGLDKAVVKVAFRVCTGHTSESGTTQADKVIVSLHGSASHAALYFTESGSTVLVLTHSIGIFSESESESEEEEEEEDEGEEGGAGGGRSGQV